MNARIPLEERIKQLRAMLNEPRHSSKERGAAVSMCGTCGEAIVEGRCQCPRGISGLAGSVKIGWWIDRDPGALFDASDLVTRLPEVLDRVENAIVSALSQCVDVFIDGEDEAPVRVMFDLGGKEIEIDDGPINGTLDDIRAELGE